MSRAKSPSSPGALALARRFAPYLRPLRTQALAALTLALAASPIAGGLLWSVQRLVDDVVVGHQFDALPLIATAFVVLTAAKIVVSFAALRIEASIVETVARDLRIDLYRHLLSLSPGSTMRHGIGDALAHLATDVERAENLIYTGPARLVVDGVTALFFCGVLIFISWHLTLVTLVALPPLAVAIMRYSPRIRRAARIARQRASDWLSLAEEKLAALPIVQAFGTGEHELQRFAAGCARTRRAELRTTALETWLNLAIESIVMLCGMLVLAAGAYEIAQGALSLGSLVAFLGSIGALYEPIRDLAKSTGRFQRGAAGARRIAELLDVKSLVTERPNAKTITRFQGAIEFRDITFSYPGGDVRTLDRLSLRVQPGEMVAIVGPSGSGKSTLIRLLMRLNDPQSGRILIDDTDIRDLSLAALRRAVAVVFQEPYIFRGSIADNIRYGRLEADRDSVIAAGRMAHVDAFAAARPAHWAAPVGPHGTWLSGGQRQRLALARALLRTAPIMVLDEATASVDSETEELIHDTVASFAGKRTILIIGHRLSSLRRADRIIVVDRGRIVESGTPQTLLRPGTRYQQLFAAQIAPGRPAA